MLMVGRNNSPFSWCIWNYFNNVGSRNNIREILLVLLQFFSFAMKNANYIKYEMTFCCLLCRQTGMWPHSSVSIATQTWNCGVQIRSDIHHASLSVLEKKAWEQGTRAEPLLPTSPHSLAGFAGFRKTDTQHAQFCVNIS